MDGKSSERDREGKYILLYLIQNGIYTYNMGDVVVGI